MEKLLLTARETADVLKVRTAAAAVDSVSATGNDPPTPRTARCSASPDEQPSQGRSHTPQKL